MLNEGPDKKAILKSVEVAIKKEGKFDKIRKIAIENLRKAGMIEHCEKQMAQCAAEILHQLPEKCSKDDMKRRIESHVFSNKQFEKDIMVQVRKELEGNWVNEKLESDIDAKIRAALNLPPEPTAQ